MEAPILNTEQAKLIADFANSQTERLVNFCKKNKHKFGDNPSAVIMTAYAINIVGILKSIQYNASHIMMPAEIKQIVLDVLDQSIEWSLN